MNTDGKKGKNVRLYIYEEDEPRLEKLCAKTGLSITNALSLIVNAGLKTLSENEYRLSLPLTFSIAEETKYRQPTGGSIRLNEGKK